MKKTYFYIVMAAILFATMEVALKIAGGALDAFQLTFLRFLIGGIFLAPFARIEIKKNKISIGWKDLLYLAMLGILSIPISMVLFQIGVSKSNASTAAVIFCINPLLTMIFANWIAHERLNRYKVAAIGFGLIGLVFMVRPWDIQPGNTVVGAIYLVVAAAFFSLYTVLGKVSIQKMGTIPQTSISFLFGSFVLLIIIWIRGGAVIANVADNLLLVLYCGIIITGLGYFCYFMGIKLSNATTGSITFFIKPAIAPFIAVLVIGDVILWNTYVGMLMILVGLFLNIKDKLSERPEELIPQIEGNEETE